MTVINMSLKELETPCLILDKKAMLGNIKRMDEKVKENGFSFRPHLKTAKSIEIAKLATKEHLGAITVSTIKEAQYFYRNGFKDILLAVCITPQKLSYLLETNKELAEKLIFISDDLRSINKCALAAKNQKSKVNLMIEIDCGDKRTGFDPISEKKQLIDCADFLKRESSIHFLGFLTHGGNSYSKRSQKEIQEVFINEEESLFKAREIFRNKGINCKTLSAGSTPTTLNSKKGTSITELRAGVYMFGDLFQWQLGSCEFKDLALSVLVSVISKKGRKIVIDAGSLALSQDRSTAKSAHDFNYGLVCDLEAQNLAKDFVTVKALNQEHGIIYFKEEPDLEVGDKLRVFPNHACITAAIYDSYNIIEDGKLTGKINRINGW